MATFGKLILILFVVQTIAYVVLSVWSRAVRRRKLIEEWEEEGQPGDRAAFLRDGLERYDNSLRRRLILGVYVVPVVVIGTIIYLTNFR